MKKYILMLATSMMMASCLDTIILPDSKTVDEDFWQTKSDVELMVNGAYAAMADNALLARLIVWGDFRGDELLRASAANQSATTDALDEIAAVNMQTTNQYATWAEVYSVINRCNIVLARAEEVMQVDPSYTLGDYQVHRSQMLALRALCYFYLVRNFRDVPYIATAYMNSSQDMNIPQSAPAFVIDQCINDLQEASSTALAARSFSTNDWERVGWMTDDAINTLLADIYLWRASVNHDQEDYQRCIDLCDKVIASKKSQHIRGRNEVTEKEYPLADAAQMYSEIFVNQNAEESIFEIQTNSNTAVCQYYYKWQKADNEGGVGWLRASTQFASVLGTAFTAATALSNTSLFYAGDLRYYASCYISSTGEEAYDIRKMISANPLTSKTTVKREGYAYGGLSRNYNVYRLTDVMLMKAEAQVQQVDTLWEAEAQTTKLREAFNLIQAVNARALHQDNVGDSIKWNTFRNYSKDQFEQLVMQERLREFCFEGRRWYDLLRYNYRHIDGVAYDRTLADLSDEGVALPANYDNMLELMTRSRGNEASGVKTKMQNESYLYMPVPNRDMLISPTLRQNPAYKDSKDYEKTY